MSQPVIAASTVKTRILIISDTHNAHPAVSDSYKRCAFKQPLPKADVLLHCGDLTMAGFPHEYESTLEMLAGIDAELRLVIAGNHDISLDKEFYHGPSKTGRWTNGVRMHKKWYEESMPDKAIKLWTGDAAKNAGVTYLQEGLHSFALKNGAHFTVYASPYQPEFCNWAFAYERDEDRFNPPADAAALVPADHSPIPAPADRPVDIVMTHGPPFQRLDRTASGLDVGCRHLLRATARARPRLHAWGHIHEAWGAERVVWGAAAPAADGAVAGEEKGGEEMGGGLKAERVRVDEEEVVERRAAYLDVSAQAPRPLRVGQETVMVNASIMDLRYAPVNAPWLVDLELPLGGRD